MIDRHVEAVARALAKFQSWRTWKDEAPADREMYRSRARKAIAAYRKSLEAAGLDVVRRKETPPPTCD